MLSVAGVQLEYRIEVHLLNTCLAIQFTGRHLLVKLLLRICSERVTICQRSEQQLSLPTVKRHIHTPCIHSDRLVFMSQPGCFAQAGERLAEQGIEIPVPMSVSALHDTMRETMHLAQTDITVKHTGNHHATGSRSPVDGNIIFIIVGHPNQSMRNVYVPAAYSLCSLFGRRTVAVVPSGILNVHMQTSPS